jgi:hypothetical protein
LQLAVLQVAHAYLFSFFACGWRIFCHAPLVRFVVWGSHLASWCTPTENMCAISACRPQNVLCITWTSPPPHLAPSRHAHTRVPTTYSSPHWSTLNANSLVGSSLCLITAGCSIPSAHRVRIQRGRAWQGRMCVSNHGTFVIVHIRPCTHS